jgi:hypothetical protein
MLSRSVPAALKALHRLVAEEQEGLAASTDPVPQAASDAA